MGRPRQRGLGAAFLLGSVAAGRETTRVQTGLSVGIYSPICLAKFTDISMREPSPAMASINDRLLTSSSGMPRWLAKRSNPDPTPCSWQHLPLTRLVAAGLEALQVRNLVGPAACQAGHSRGGLGVISRLP